MAPSAPHKDDSPAAAFGRAHRFVLRLVWFYGALAAAVAALLALPGWQLLAASPVVSVIAEAVASGVGAAALAVLLLILSALLAVLVLTQARRAVSVEARVIQLGFRKRIFRVVLHPIRAGFAARVLQSVILPVGLIAIGAAVWWAWPVEGAAAPTSATSNLLAAAVLILAFPVLVSERMMVAYSSVELPEAPALRRLLLLTTIVLAAAGGLELLRGFGFAWATWPIRILAFAPVLISVELSLRALARLFLPPPSAADAKAATESMLADVLTRGPRAPAQLIKSHLGLDFSRSWALTYLSAAIMPAILATAAFCWMLTGVKLVNTGQRSVYEQFGAPVAVMGPGIHFILPWPLGQTRSVEFGEIHSVAAGTDQAQDADQSVSAEAVPPASLNRLWTTAHATEAGFLVATEGSGQQNFQTVSTEILVLYRVGLTDQDVLNAAYSVENPEMLVREAGSRLALRYFAARTLDTVMGAQRERLQEELRAEITRDLAPVKSGIEIVDVVVAEIHPPAGASAAWHAVTAAEINALASVSQEKAAAKATMGDAQSQAVHLVNDATAAAIERVQTATGDAYRFAADKKSHDLSPRSFLMERSYSKLVSALSKSPIMLLDHRVSPAAESLLDLRPPPGQSQISPPLPPPLTPQEQ